MLMLISAYFVNYYMSSKESLNNTENKPLAFYEFYPVISTEGRLSLDRAKINDAITNLSTSIVNDRASSELIRLIEENSASFLIDSENNKAAAKLAKRAYHPESDNHELLRTFKSVVKGIGQTISGTPIEIVLHDTRNPLKSVIAIENPITGRRLYDQNTNFGLELIKKYSKSNIKNTNIVSYPITLKDGRVIKATTIPIYDNGELIAFICINIDTSRINKSNPFELQTLIDSLTKISPETEYIKIKEIIPPIEQGNKYMSSNRMRYELEKPLLIIQENKGILACAYINPETCNKTGEACAIVSGVNNYEDMMSAKVIATSEQAQALGVRVGDTGAEALDKLK